MQNRDKIFKSLNIKAKILADSFIKKYYAKFCRSNPLFIKPPPNLERIPKIYDSLLISLLNCSTVARSGPCPTVNDTRFNEPDASGK